MDGSGPVDGNLNFVNNMKLTKYGLRLKLLQFSSDLSVTGIFVTIVEIIGGIAIVALRCSQFQETVERMGYL